MAATAGHRQIRCGVTAWLQRPVIGKSAQILRKETLLIWSLSSTNTAPTHEAFCSTELVRECPHKLAGNYGAPGAGGILLVASLHFGQGPSFRMSLPAASENL